MDKMNLTIVKGYPSRSSEASGLFKDQFVKIPWSQARWYDIHSDKKSTYGLTVQYWYNEPTKLNSAYCNTLWIRNYTTSSQNILRKWERLAREFSFICIQVAGFSCCLTRLQENVTAQLKMIKDNKAKGKSYVKAQEATEELTYLMNFNWSITFAVTRTMQDFSDFVFVNITKHDSFLDHLKSGYSGSSQDCTHPSDSLILDSVIRRLKTRSLNMMTSIIKHPTRGACLCMGEATTLDPHFLFAIALQP